MPSVIARSDTAVFGPLGRRRFFDHGLTGTAGFAVNFVGPRALPFSQTAASTLELDASAGVRWTFLRLGAPGPEPHRRALPADGVLLRLELQTDGQPPTLVPTEHFTAAPPFSLLATLSFLFDGENGR